MFTVLFTFKHLADSYEILPMIILEILKCLYGVYENRDTHGIRAFYFYAIVVGSEISKIKFPFSPKN